MELPQGTHKASKFKPQDFISSMPDNVITNIMDRLMLHDVIRTSILSRNWRFKWTMLTQLVFDEYYFLTRLSYYEGKNDFSRILSRLLLHLKGGITKFFLHIDEKWYSEHAADISHWILFLATKGIKDLTLEKRDGTPLKLPTHLYSCLELNHLELFNCFFDPPTSFHGFPSLLSLHLHYVQLESGKFQELFTQCHVLESLNISHSTGRVKLAEIAKLSNLKILSLFLCNLDNTGSGSVLELKGFLPKLQELNLNFRDYKLTEGIAEKRFPTTFPCLKTLELSDIDLGNGIKLSYAFQMIWSFPNLQTLKITSGDLENEQTGALGSPEVDYNTMGLLQLRSVKFGNLKGLENEIWLIKYLLACSPFLKKIIICLRFCVPSHEKFNFACKLLKLHRASPVVAFWLYSF